ncbi:tetraspanin-2 [Dioscorea cayenensis subsp. rotundata]|uniref:Tetraspanin-2 n=1 Tax=Dioscorea cayennensis subsp. rotundata TaxID=55577 RepID=A0AB40CRR8_DIOCR|nr:tetraspanin-2 [Dioscorea cayenensis subsp. rotundata]
MGVSNNIVAVVNFIAMLCSIPIIGAGIWLASKQDNACVHLFRWPVIIIGVLLLLVSLFGFVGAVWDRPCLLATHLFCMAALVLLLLTLLVFAFVVTRPDGSYPAPARAYSEYRLEGYSGWLKTYILDHWPQIRACLSANDVCGKLARRDAFFTADQFFRSGDLSPIQSGCCKPPTLCGYNYVNPTLWINPTNPMADPDCYTWNTDQSLLCYGCNSCKAGILGSLRHEWRKANIALIVATVALIWVYIIGCSAFKNAQTEELFRRYKRGWV